MAVSEGVRYFISQKYENREITSEENRAIREYDINVEEILKKGCDLKEIIKDRILSDDSYKRTLISLSQILDSENQISEIIRNVVFKSRKNNTSISVELEKHTSWILDFKESTERSLNVLRSRDILRDVMEDYTRTISSFHEILSGFKVRDDKSLSEKKSIKRGRKAFVRGVNFFKSLFGSKDIELFISGDEIIFEGDFYNYCISSTGNLIYKTVNTRMVSSPFKIRVETKVGIVLGYGCTVFENTPVIDQLIALRLHLMEDEENVLKNMNITQRTASFDKEEKLLLIYGKSEPRKVREEIPRKRKVNPNIRKAIEELSKKLNIDKKIILAMHTPSATSDELTDCISLEYNHTGVCSSLNKLNFLQRESVEDSFLLSD